MVIVPTLNTGGVTGITPLFCCPGVLIKPICAIVEGAIYPVGGNVPQKP